MAKSQDYVGEEKLSDHLAQAMATMIRPLEGREAEIKMAVFKKERLKS